MSDSQDKSDETMLDMRRYYVEGYSETEIARHLKLSKEKFQEYRQQIYEEDREALERAANGDLAHDIIVLKERLEASLRNCHEIAMANDVRVRERLEAERMKMDAAVNILRLLHEGPEALGIGHKRENKQAANPENAAEKEDE